MLSSVNKTSEGGGFVIMDKISVIVPIYNVEKELSRCVESLLKQDYADFEIILVDDGSQDSSGKIADSFAEANPSRVCVVHQVNKGLSGARNTGIRVATGQYLSFVDSDDYVEPNMLSVLMEQLQKVDADIATCGRFDDYPEHSKTNFTMEKPMVFSAEETIRRILTWNQLDVSSCDKLFKKNLWDGISFPERENNEDIRTIPLVISNSEKVVHVGVALYHYCHRENSITTTYNLKKIKDFYKAIQCVETFVQNQYPAIREELVYFLNHTYLSLWMMCSQIRYHGIEEKIAKKYLNNNWNNAYSLQKMSKRDKLAYKLLLCRVYYPFKVVKGLCNKMMRKGRM